MLKITFPQFLDFIVLDTTLDSSMILVHRNDIRAVKKIHSACSRQQQLSNKTHLVKYLYIYQPEVRFTCTWHQID